MDPTRLHRRHDFAALPAALVRGAQACRWALPWRHREGKPWTVNQSPASSCHYTTRKASRMYQHAQQSCIYTCKPSSPHTATCATPGPNGEGGQARPCSRVWTESCPADPPTHPPDRLPALASVQASVPSAPSSAVPPSTITTSVPSRSVLRQSNNDHDKELACAQGGPAGPEGPGAERRTSRHRAS